MGFIIQSTEKLTRGIEMQMISRAYRAAGALKKAELQTLRGQGSGRRYRVPGTKVFYNASAPGQPPAVRTGAYRISFLARARNEGNGVFRSSVESGLSVNGWNLGNLLEDGTRKMAPRPHDERIIEKAAPEIIRIYSQPFTR